MFAKNQVNIVLICFNPRPGEIKSAENFVRRIKQLSADSMIPVEAFLLFDPSAEDVEELMMKRVANYRYP